MGFKSQGMTFSLQIENLKISFASNKNKPGKPMKKLVLLVLLNFTFFNIYAQVDSTQTTQQNSEDEEEEGDEMPSTEEREALPEWYYSFGADGVYNSGNVNRQ